MGTFTRANFEDPQGITHELAVFEIARANLSSNSNSIFTNRLGEEPQLDEVVNVNLTYDVFFWPSQESKDAGKPPYLLTNAGDGGNTFYLNITDNRYSGMDSLQAAELHCTTVTLPE